MALWYTIEYMKYLFIYIKGMWKVILYTDSMCRNHTDPKTQCMHETTTPMFKYAGTHLYPITQITINFYPRLPFILSWRLVNVCGMCISRCKFKIYMRCNFFLQWELTRVGKRHFFLFSKAIIPCYFQQLNFQDLKAILQTKILFHQQ